MKNIVLPIVFALLTACASQPARISQTVSGWPEIEISTADKKSVKDYILLKNSESGWNLEQETESMLSFSKVNTESPRLH